VISNIDARETFETLLKGTPLPNSYLLSVTPEN
jgi:hypothetical protein